MVATAGGVSVWLVGGDGGGGAVAAHGDGGPGGGRRVTVGAAVPQGGGVGEGVAGVGVARVGVASEVLRIRVSGGQAGQADLGRGNMLAREKT